MVDFFTGLTPTIEGWAGIAGVIIFLGLFFWFLTWRNKRLAEYGSRRERAVLKRAGREFVNVSEEIKKLEEGAEAEKKEAEHVEAEEEALEAEEKKAKASPEAVKETKAEEELALAVKEEAKAEKESAAVTGRTLGLIAGLQQTLNAFRIYLSKRKKTEKKEELEIPLIEELMNKLENTIKYAAVDSMTVKYLEELFNKIGKDVEAITNDEKSKEKDMKELIVYVKDAIKEMQIAAKQARTDLNRLQTAEKKERKHYDKEIKNAQNAIKEKRKKLKQIKKKGKKADPRLIASLAREITLASNQIITAKTINKRLKDTYAYMKKEIKEMKNLLRKILRAERIEKKYARALQKREEQFEKRFKKLEDSSNEIKKHAASFTQGANPNEITIELSQDISGFFEKFNEVIKEDMEFDVHSKNITIENIILSEQIAAFEKLEQSLTKSEEAVEQGAKAMAELLAAISSNAESKVSSRNILNMLAQAGARVNYEERIQKYMEAMTQRIKNQTAAVEKLIDQLIEMGKQTMAEAAATKEKNLSGLGKAMATSVARKEAIDAKYRPKAEAFGAVLEKRNKIAAAAYKQARKAA